MKKTLALLLAAVLFAVMLTACGDKSEKKTDPPAATEKAAETVTEALTEEPTEEATEAPTGEQTEAPAAADSAFTYTDPAGIYQLTVPVIWNETGLIKEETDVDGNECVRFYYKASYEQGAGHVFSVILVDDPSKIIDVTQMPHSEDLFNDGKRQVYVMYPTDVQFAPYDEPGSADFNKQQAEYSALYETRQGIIDSFRFV